MWILDNRKISGFSDLEKKKSVSGTYLHSNFKGLTKDVTVSKNKYVNNLKVLRLLLNHIYTSMHIYTYIIIC